MLVHSQRDALFMRGEAFDLGQVFDVGGQRVLLRELTEEAAAETERLIDRLAAEGEAASEEG